MTSPRPPSQQSTDAVLFPADIVLNRLKQGGARIQGSRPSWMATCPAHADLTPSLSITDTANGTLLLKCWGGCDTSTVLACLGLTFRHLFPSRAARALDRRSHGAIDFRSSGSSRDESQELSPEERRQLHAYLAASPAPGFALHQLSVALRLPVEAVSSVGLGYDAEECCWLMPEKDGKGRLVGIVRRFSNGQQFAVAGSQRGLTILPSWKSRPGPLYLAEGASDALALYSVGTQAVGRPGAQASNNVKAWTVQLLVRAIDRWPDLEIIVVGDRDEVGRDGARVLAAHLAEHLRRRVRVALPRAPYTDVRDQIVAGKWKKGLDIRRPSKNQPQRIPAQTPELIRRAVDQTVRTKVARRNQQKRRSAR